MLNVMYYLLLCNNWDDLQKLTTDSIDKDFLGLLKD